MRLWHEGIDSSTSPTSTFGATSECCALRGNGWGGGMRQLTMSLPIPPTISMPTIA